MKVPVLVFVLVAAAWSQVALSQTQDTARPSGVLQATVQPPRWQALEHDVGCAVWNGYPQASETARWDGPCVAGKAHGEGVLIWRYREPQGWEEARYAGGMLGGRKHGYGVFTWADGSHYAGYWTDGRADGYGSYVNPFGERFTGSWSNGCFSQGDRWATVDATPADCGF